LKTGSRPGSARRSRPDPEEKNPMQLPFLFLFLFGFITGPWEPLPGPEGGPVYDIAAKENGVYIAARGGGPHELAGDSWFFLGDGLPNQVAECIETLDEHVYAGLYQESLRISDDWGASWRNTFSPIDIVDVAVDPSDWRNIYVGSYDLQTVYGSTNGGDSWRSLIYDTGAPVACIEIAPSNRDYVYVGTENNYEAGGLYSSTNRGGTWSTIDCYGMENSAMAVVIDENNPEHILAGSHFWGVFETTDRGTTWRERNSGLGHRNIRALAAEGDLQLVLAGTSLGGLYRSVNGGGSCVSVSDGLPPGMTVWSIEKDEHVAGRWWLGSNTGCYCSLDDGMTWHETNDGLHGQFILDFAYGETIQYAAAESGVFFSGDGGTSWMKDEAGLPENDRMIPYIAASRASDTIVFAATGTKVYRSIDGGRNWSGRSFGIAPFTAMFGIVSSASNPDRVYAATLHSLILGGGIYRTDNGGALWRKKNTGLGLLDFVPLDIVVNDRNDENVFVLLYLRGIYRSNNGGDNWTLAISGIDDFLNLNCLSIASADPEILFAGTASGKIYKSIDGASSWHILNSVPPELIIYSIAVHPYNSSRLCAVTSAGIISSADGGAAWRFDNNGLNNGIIPNTASFCPSGRGDLYLGTAGCSIYRQSNVRIAAAPLQEK